MRRMQAYLQTTGIRRICACPCFTTAHCESIAAESGAGTVHDASHRFHAESCTEPVPFSACAPRQNSSLSFLKLHTFFVSRKTGAGSNAADASLLANNRYSPHLCLSLFYDGPLRVNAAESGTGTVHDASHRFHAESCTEPVPFSARSRKVRNFNKP